MTKQIFKSLNEDKRLATFVVLEPQDDDGTTTDLHGDWYSAETVEDACYNFNMLCKQANLLHQIQTTVFEFVESYITQADMDVNGVYIKKGTWLATIKVERSEFGDEIWEGIKSGELNGLSVQCVGLISDIG